MIQYSDNQYSNKFPIRKDNIYNLFKTFAKEYKREYRNTPLEIIVVGGGSILMNYGFREGTTDIDVMTRSMSELKSIINRIADNEGLTNDWINSDFTRTDSFSEKLREVSKHYCSFNNGSIEIRTVDDENLIAMKMIAARPYRNDVSDIVGIIKSIKESGGKITMDMINKAMDNLYPGKRASINVDFAEFVEQVTLSDVKELNGLYEKLNEEDYLVAKQMSDLKEKYNAHIDVNSATNIANHLRAVINNSQSDNNNSVGNIDDRTSYDPGDDFGDL